MNEYIRPLRAGALCATLLFGGALGLVGCSGDDGAPGPAGPPGPPGSGIGGVPEQDIFAQVDADGDGGSDGYAVLDGNTFEIKRTGGVEANTDSSLNNSHKSFYFTGGDQWIGGGGDLWAFDTDTFALVSRKDNPSFQANREGTIGAGLVNTKSAATSASLPKQLKAFIGRSQLSMAEADNVDMCEVMALSGAGSGATKAPADTIVYNMGYSPVGLELTPDGKMAVVGVRQGDHLLFIDADPTSPTFAEPVRFVIQRTGEIKDKSNAVVGTFASQYAGFGGTAPGNLRRVRAGGATGGETDGETYVEPCDTTVLRNTKGETWFCSVDVDGDTYTCARVDTITSATPTVHQFKVPLVDDAAAPAGGAGTPGVQYVGPWMGSLGNRVGGGEFLLSSENEGENTDGVWDVSDPANPVEVERMVADLATVKGEGACTPGAAGGSTLGASAPFTDGQVLAVNLDFTSTGGACTPVNYTYRALAGDDGSGSAGIGFVTTAYLEKNTATDPGPNFILNGLAGRAGTAEFNLVTKTGSGPTATLYSDQLWLFTFVNGPLCTAGINCDIFQIVDLSSSPPWLITEIVDFPSQFAGKMGPGNRVLQVANDTLEVIAMDYTPRSRRTVRLFDPDTAQPWAIKSFFIRAP
jgi:hypothetical protein